MAEVEPEVVRAMRRFKAGLAARDEAMLRALARRYAQLERALEAQIEALAEEAARRAAAGEAISRWQVQRWGRYEKLLAQLQAEMGRYVDDAAGVIATEQRAQVLLGLQQSSSLVWTLAPGAAGLFDVLPVQALEYLIGLVSDGSPLRAYLLKVYPQAAEAMMDALVQGMGQGWGAARIAREMRRAATVSLRTAMNTARTETTRAYRAASLAQYQASGLVEGYRRLAAKSTRTCFPAGVMVDTATGPKPIEQVCVGEAVWTGERRLRMVREVSRRPYAGRMVTLRTRYGLSVEATEEHPVLVNRQGQLQWIAAGQIIPGDAVYRCGNSRMENAEHVLPDFSIERSIGQANNDVSLRLQAQGFSPVSIGALVPVNAVNLQNDIAVRKVEINWIAVYSGFLNKALVHQSKTPAGIGLRCGLSGVLAIAARAAKLLIRHRGHYSEGLAAGFTGEHERRASAKFTAILSIEGAAKRFAASLADVINLLAHFGGAGSATAPGGFGFRWRKTHDVAAVGARFFNLDAAANFVTGSGAECFWFTGVMPKWLAAVGADSFGSFALIDSAALSTTTYGSSAIDHRGRSLECLTADRAENLYLLRESARQSRPFAFDAAVSGRSSEGARVIRDKVSAFRTWLGNQFTYSPMVYDDTISSVEITVKPEITVYNLEVEEDHTYFANGLLVHNCPACLMLDGVWFPLETPFAEHVCGRCVAIPGLARSGTGQSGKAGWTTGREWFEGLDAGKQREILGPGLYQAWRDGKIGLEDVPVLHEDLVWGNSWQVARVPK